MDPTISTDGTIMSSYVVLVITALTSPFAVFINVLTLFAFYKNPSLRSRANIFLIALAGIDLMKCSVASPLFIAIHARYQFKSPPSCTLITLMYSASQFTLLTSRFLLTAMNIERFISIKCPAWHRVNVTKSKLVKVSIICNLLSLLIVIVVQLLRNA